MSTAASSSSSSWEALGPGELERQFNPRAWLGDEAANEIIDEWRRLSAERRSSLPGPFDVPYGTHPSERLDVHRSSSRRSDGDDGDGGGGGGEGEAGEEKGSSQPLVIFVHGGWWRALDKSDMDHHVYDLHAVRGWHVINVNYPLCPSVPLTRLYDSLERAIRFVFKNLPSWKIDAKKAFLVGHSVGGHAVSYLSSRFAERLNGVVAVSGVYDVRVVRSISVQRDVRMTEEESDRFNLLASSSSSPEGDASPSPSSSSAAAPTTVPFLVTAGGDEPPFWIRQSESYVNLLSERRKGGNGGEEGDDDDDGGVVWGLVEGADHFSVMDELVRPGTAWSEKLDRFVSSNR